MSILSRILIILLAATTDISVLVEANVVSCDPCIDRSQVKIACVHHGLPTEDIFWQFLDAAIAQGAQDMGIDLVYDPISNFTLEEKDEPSVEAYMSSRIEELCSEGVNGIFISLPSPSIIAALNKCREANIPALVFNAGIAAANENEYLFVGQDEKQAGYDAGAGLAKVDGLDTFCCINHAPGVGVLDDRCGGFSAGLEANGVAVGFTDVHVNPNNCSAWEEAVADNCSPANGNWSTVGLYLAGQANHNCGVEFLRKYPSTYADASDVSDDLYAGMNEGLNILFGIDQQAYLQGYFPNSFLTLASTNNQIVQNENIETGPRLVTEPPSEHYQQCKANAYAVCDASGDISSSGAVSPTRHSFGIFSHCLLFGVSFLLTV